MGDIFISYSRTDRAYVEDLADYLSAGGVGIWFDYEIASGERFSKVIKRRIETCDAMIVVMSPEADDSDWVESEVRLARELGKAVLPLLLDGKPFYWLSSLHYSDVRGGALPGPEFLARLRRLALADSAQPAAADAAKPDALPAKSNGRAFRPAGPPDVSGSPRSTAAAATDADTPPPALPAKSNGRATRPAGPPAKRAI